MLQLVHVISDLHLGGAAATPTAPAFRMCPPATHQLLAAFLDRLPARTAEQESHLVIAGDIVDFLAEAPFEAFTADPAQACAKLARILADSAVIWQALRRFADERDGHITLMLGNHDIELALPAVRALLAQALPGARVRFIYDNEALTMGPLLIEHGNRFDAWNAVPHGALRRVRSQQSRQAPVTPAFVPPPGSRMVIDVLNPLKRQYPFIDLLKPETAAALPLAAALGALGLQQAWDAYSQFRARQAVDFDEESGEPLGPGYVSAGANPDRELWLAAQAIARGGGGGSGCGGNGQQISAAADLLGKGAAIVTDLVRAARVDAVYAAFRQLAALRRMHDAAFDVAQESDTYLKPARRAAAAGFRVIVYGHTHLPKQVQLDGAVYLNTGTWADVMCIPAGIWDEDEAAGQLAFRAFAADLGAGTVERWRRTLPTYARITLDGDSVAAGLHFGDDDSAVSTAAVMQRLRGGGAA
jgi:UDP-2,3-diacylglucosamine pyrophosphatase LpxH